MTNEAQMHVEGEGIKGIISFSLNDGRVTKVLGIAVFKGNRRFSFGSDRQLNAIIDSGAFPSFFNVSEDELQQIKFFAEQSLIGFTLIHIKAE